MPTSRKTILILGITGLLLLGVIIVVLLPGPNSSQPTEQPSSVTFPTPQNTGWIEKKTSQYTISYPSDWKLAEGTIANNAGSHDVLTPKTSNKEDPSLIIQVTDASVNPIDQMAYLLKNFSYKTETVVVDGISTTKYLGRFRKPVAKEERAIVLQKQATVYLLKFTYYANGPDAVLEQMFVQIYSKIQLH